MPTLAELMTNLVKKAGINPETMKDFLSVEQLQINAPDELAVAVSEKLLTVEQGKNNAELNSYFKAMHLDGVDASLAELTKEFSPDLQAELKALPTTKRAKRILEEKAKQNEEKALSAMKDKDGMKEAYEKLKQEALEKESGYKKLLEEKDHKMNAELTEALFDNYLSGVQWGDDRPAEVNKLTAKSLIQMEMKERKAAYKRSGFSLDLIQEGAPDLKYQENNNDINFKTFADRVLAKNKMIKTSEGSNNNTPPPAAANQYRNNGAGAQNVVNPAAARQMDQILGDFSKS